jgi:hypothetical protein
MTNVHAVDKSTWQQIAAHARDVRERFRELRIIITKDAVKISTTVLDEGGKALKADIDTVVSIIHEALKSRVSIEEAILSYIEKQPYGEEARKYILNPYRDIINELSYRLWEEGGRQHNRALDYWLSAQRGFLETTLGEFAKTLPPGEVTVDRVSAEDR